MGRTDNDFLTLNKQHVDAAISERSQVASVTNAVHCIGLANIDIQESIDPNISGAHMDSNL